METQQAVAPVVAGDTRRPAMTFRIGITGASTLPPDDDPVFAHLRAQIDDVLKRVHGQLAELLDRPRVRDCYDAAAMPMLRFLSPLGEGADRLFARAALDLAAATQAKPAMCLEVILPFDQAAYEKTFSLKEPARHRASVAAFRQLLAEAACGVLELDGEGTDDIVRPQSYEAVGRAIVRNADLMIAVWDEGAAAKGRGGTRDTVHYALQAGVPVWLIDAAGKLEPQFLTDPLDFWRPRIKPERADAARETYVESIVAPPESPAAARNRLLDYYNEPLKACLNIWLIHPRLMRRLRGNRKNPGAPFIWLWGALGRGTFGERGSIPGELSQAYQNRYRSSYLLVFVAAALALISAVLGILFPSIENFTTGFEFATLSAVAALVIFNHKDRWHERYVGYRLIAELARTAPYLHALGWGLPFNRMRRAAGGAPDGWIAWLAAAHTRSVPMPVGILKTELPGRRDEIVQNLLTPQIAFHEDRHRQCHLAGKRLETAGQLLFGATMIIVIFKSIGLFLGADFLSDYCSDVPNWIDNETFVHVFAGVAAVLPALSAAAFGIKAYEEFEQLSELSDQMKTDLERCRTRIESIDLVRPLASQMIATELFEAASIMLTEASGWARLFRMKVVDA